MTKEELTSLMEQYGKKQVDLSNDLGVARSQISMLLSGGAISPWANAALEQYFTNLELKKRLDDLYPITKKKL